MFRKLVLSAAAVTQLFVAEAAYAAPVRPAAVSFDDAAARQAMAPIGGVPIRTATSVRDKSEFLGPALFLPLLGLVGVVVVVVAVSKSSSPG